LFDTHTRLHTMKVFAFLFAVLSVASAAETKNLRARELQSGSYKRVPNLQNAAIEAAAEAAADELVIAKPRKYSAMLNQIDFSKIGRYQWRVVLGYKKEGTSSTSYKLFMKTIAPDGECLGSFAVTVSDANGYDVTQWGDYFEECLTKSSKITDPDLSESRTGGGGGAVDVGPNGSKFVNVSTRSSDVVGAANFAAAQLVRYNEANYRFMSGLTNLDTYKWNTLAAAEAVGGATTHYKLSMNMISQQGYCVGAFSVLVEEFKDKYTVLSWGSAVPCN
jgi:hypothetical protein